jgi:hypothetical protein
MRAFFTVNVFALEFPPGLTTITGPVVAPTGTVHMMTALVHEETVATTPLNVTVDAP